MIDNETLQEMRQQLAECEDIETPFDEGFADTVVLFGNRDFGVWLTSDDPVPFEDSFDGAIDYPAFDDAFEAADDIVRGLDDNDAATHPYAKQYVRQTASARFSAAFEKLCARYGVSPEGTPEEQAETLARLQREGKTGRLGATLLFWRLYDELAGDDYAQKVEMLYRMGVRL